MKIWKWSSDVEDYNCFTMPNDKEVDKVLFDYEFNGSSIKERWQAVKVEVFGEQKRGDTPSFACGCPVLSENAVIILGDFLMGVTEVLPLNYSEEKFYAINVLDVVDCIDYEKATCKRFSSSNKVMRFIEYAFKPEAIKNKHIFKIPELPKSYVLVSDEFRNKVIESGLEGFVLEELWDSEK